MGQAIKVAIWRWLMADKFSISGGICYSNINKLRWVIFETDNEQPGSNGRAHLRTSRHRPGMADKLDCLNCRIQVEQPGSSGRAHFSTSDHRPGMADTLDCLNCRVEVVEHISSRAPSTFVFCWHSCQVRGTLHNEVVPFSDTQIEFTPSIPFTRACFHFTWVVD